ncbi:MAG: excinuclease ABC subunit UvrC [Firmicutes bacterium]|nr:excinuclease ABC subunit UvrC [Bacillota bacterium]
MFDIKENLKMLPEEPGVYMHKDKLGNIIYVGKAISLRNRVRQYFQSSRNMAPKVRSMVSQIAEFEYITVGSEMEALILECNLIKKYRPKYNVLLRDDKTYPYIKVTNEEYPRVMKTRQLRKDGGKYFGPYSDAGAVNKIVDFLNASFELKRCSAVAFPKDFKPCLNYHINQCRGICTGLVSKEEYTEAVAGALEFLNGHNQPVIARLNAKMKEASDAMEYEEAAAYRDYIQAAKALAETQRVVMRHSDDADIVLPCPTEEEAYMVIFSVREGKLIGRESYALDAKGSVDDDEKAMLSAFLTQHYSRMATIPKEILVSRMPDDAASLEAFLTKEAGHNVRIIRPERGEKRALVRMAQKDAGEMMKTIGERAAAAKERKQTLGREIWEVLTQMERASDPDEQMPQEYDGREFRAEAYDISNTNGIDTVGAMVVFNGLTPDRKSYRKFKVRTVQGQDDYASMQEVLSRRFLRLFDGDDKFSVLPDIIFMDGGKGHVSTALEVIRATGFEIPVVGMVKDEHHRTRALTYQAGNDWHEIPLAGKPLLYKYIGRMQEEVHRFAIEYHRKLRGKNVSRSLLDEIEGIGPVRKRGLLEAFGSIEKIRELATSDAEEDRKMLAAAPGMDQRAAENVRAFFKGCEKRV